MPIFCNSPYFSSLFSVFTITGSYQQYLNNQSQARTTHPSTSTPHRFPLPVNQTPNNILPFPASSEYLRPSAVPRQAAYAGPYGLNTMAAAHGYFDYSVSSAMHASNMQPRYSNSTNALTHPPSSQPPTSFTRQGGTTGQTSVNNAVESSPLTLQPPPSAPPNLQPTIDSQQHPLPSHVVAPTIIPSNPSAPTTSSYHSSGKRFEYLTYILLTIGIQ